MAQTVGDGGGSAYKPPPPLPTKNKKKVNKKLPKPAVTTTVRDSDSNGAAREADAAAKAAAAQRARIEAAARLAAEQKATQRGLAIRAEQERAAQANRGRNAQTPVDAHVILANATRAGLDAMGDGFIGGGRMYSPPVPKDDLKTPEGLLAAMKSVAADQAARNGTGFDRDRLDRIDGAFAAQASHLDHDLNWLVLTAQALERKAAKGNKKAAADLLLLAKSPEFLNISARYDALYVADNSRDYMFDRFGHSQESLFEQFYGTRQSISQVHEQYWLGQVASQIFGTPTAYIDLQKRYPGLTQQQIEDQLGTEYDKRLELAHLQAEDQREADALLAQTRRVEIAKLGDAPRYVIDAARGLGYNFEMPGYSGTPMPGQAPAYAESPTQGPPGPGVNFSDPRVTRRIVDRAMAAWDADHGWNMDWAAGGPGNLPSSHMRALDVERDAFRDQLYLMLQGRKAPSNVESAFESVISMPAIDGALKLLGIVPGLIGAGFRGMAAKDGTEFSGVGFNLNALGQADWSKVNLALPSSVRGKFGTGQVGGHRGGVRGRGPNAVDWDMAAFEAWRKTPEGTAWWKAWVNEHPSYGPALFTTGPTGQYAGNYFPGADMTAEDHRQRVADQGAELGSQWDAAMSKAGGGDFLGGWWDAVTAVSGWGLTPYAPEANLHNLVATTVLDPTNLWSGSVFFRGLQLARARSGLSGARSIGADYLRTLADYRFGFGTPVDDPIRHFLAQRDVAKILNRKYLSPDDLKGLTDEDKEKILEDTFMRHIDNPNREGILGTLERYFRGTPIDPVQLQRAAEDLLDEMLLFNKTKPMRHTEFAGLRDRLRTAVDDAERAKITKAANDAAEATDRKVARAARDVRERRLVVDKKPGGGRFERSPDFENAPKTLDDIDPAHPTYKRPGDFRAPESYRVMGDRHVRYYGKDLEKVDGFRLTVHSPSGQAEDVIAIAEDLARTNKLGMRWARNPAATRAAPTIELFGGDQATMLTVARKLDELLAEYRLGSKPPAGSPFRAHGKVQYRWRSSDKGLEKRSLAGEHIAKEDPFQAYARRERMLGRIDSKIDGMADGLADLQNRLNAALNNAAQGESPAEAGRLAADLKRAVRRHDAYKRLRDGAAKEQREALAHGRPSRTLSAAEKGRRDFLASGLKRDEAFLRIEASKLRREFAQATTAAEKARIQALLRDIEDAMAGIELARADSLGAAHLADAVSTRYVDDAAQYVRPSSIAPKVASEDGLRVVRGGELHARWHGRDISIEGQVDGVWAGRLGQVRLRDAAKKAETTPVEVSVPAPRAKAAPAPAPRTKAAPAKESKLSTPEFWRSETEGYPKKGKPGMEFSQDDPTNPSTVTIIARDDKGHVVGVLRMDTDVGDLADEIAYFRAGGGADALDASKKIIVDRTVLVRPDARRSGWATRMYDFAEANGFDVKSYSGLSTSYEGAAFSKAYKGPRPVAVAAPAAPAAKPTVRTYPPTALPASLLKTLAKPHRDLLLSLPYWSQNEALVVLARTSKEAKAVLHSRMESIRAGFTGQFAKEQLDDIQLLDALLAARRPDAVGFNNYRKYDSAVSAAVRDERGTKAAGQFRGVVPEWIVKTEDELADVADEALGASAPGPLIRTDSDDAIELAKIKALAKFGLDKRAYDELRAIYAPALVREQRWAAISAEATKRAAKDGRSFDEHFLEVRAEYARFEARMQLRRFVLLAGDGGKPADYWDAFVRAQDEAALKPFERRPITPFQDASMKRAIEVELGVRSITDTEQLKAALRGIPPSTVADMKGMRLAEIGEFPEIPSGVPVWISSEPLRLADGTPADAYFRRNYGLVIGPRTPGQPIAAITVSHEYAHALISFARREGDPLANELLNLAGANIDDLDRAFVLASRGYESHELVDEALAEVYASWRNTQHLTSIGATADELAGPYTWERLLEFTPASAHQALEDMAERFGKLEHPSPEYFGLNLDVAPPFNDATKAREWLVENGYWSPALGDDILAGRKVWSLDAEQDFWTGRYGSTPAWADEALFDGTVVLHQRFAYEEAMRSVGTMNRRFEEASGTHAVTDAKRAIAYGDEAAGIKPARGALDKRDWFIQRFGKRVSSDGEHLTDGAAWLMNPTSDEYLKYAEKYAATGMLDKTLVTPAQSEAFGRAVRAAVQKRIDRMKAAGELAEGATIIPQEQVRLALDIVDELLDNPSWRSFFQRMPLGERSLAIAGFIQRLNVITQPAFAIMNVFETLPFIGPKRWFLQLSEMGLPSHVVDEVLRKVPDLAAFGLGPQTTLWDIAGRSAYQRLRQSDNIFRAGGVRDFFGRTGTVVRHGVGAAVEAPFSLSAVAENHLKLGFAQRLFQARWQHYLDEGLDDATATILARYETAQRVRHLFPTLEGAPLWLHALNQIIPFLSYAWNTNILYAGALLAHPQLLRQFNLLGDEWRKANLAAWQEEHPGLPFPSNKQLGEFVFSIGDGPQITIDFGKFSDVTRGWQTIPFLLSGRDETVANVITRFIRVPHPWQAAVIARAIGGNEPWSGDPATDGSWLWPVDVMELLNELSADGTLSVTDLVRLFSKVAFFAEPKPLDVFASLNAAYWALPEGAARDRFLALHPELAEHWKSIAPEPWRVTDGVPEQSWFDHHTPEEAAALKDAQRGMTSLRTYYDDKLDDLLRAGVLPNDPRYKALEAERRNELMQYRLDHPELISINAFYMTPQEWAEHEDEMLTDREVDLFFAMDADKPVREDFESAAMFQKALSGWYDQREIWLEAHPRVQAVFNASQNGIEAAIAAHNDHIAEVREQIAARNIAIAKASAAGDHDLAASLRYINELSYLQIDRPVAVEYDPPPNDVEWRGVRDYLKGHVPYVAVLPGAHQQRWNNATPEERNKMIVDNWYAGQMDEIWKIADHSKNPGATFLAELKDRPTVLAEYFRRNPGKRAEYAQNDRYFALIDKAVRSGNWDGFFHELSVDPDLAYRWAFGSGGGQYKIPDAAKAALIAAMARVRASGKGDAIWTAIQDNPVLREAYFHGADGREQKWHDNQRYLETMRDLVTRSKRTGDWSIFWDEIENNDWLRKKWIAADPEHRSNWQQKSWYAREMGSIMRRVKKTGDWNVFWDAIKTNKKLREEWFSHKPGRREDYYRNQRYIAFIGDLVERSTRTGNWDIFWNGLDDNPAMARIYYKNHPGSKNERGQNSQYGKLMGGWVKLLDAKKYDQAQAYFDSLPSWAKERYRKNHPDSARNSAYIGAMQKWVGFFERGDPDGAMSYFNGLPTWMKERYYAKHPDKRDGFSQDSAYSKAMAGWIKLLEADDHEGARAYFNALPDAIKERYWKAHPEKRDFTVDQDMFAKLTAMFELQPSEQADYLEANPDLVKWMGDRAGGKEEVRRAMILQVYRAIPPGQSWLKGVLRDRYPEIFSKEAQAARQDAKTAAQLAAHPELAEGYQRYIDLIVQSYLGSVAHSAKPPKMLTKVQREAWEATRKKRLSQRRTWQIMPTRSAVPGLANVQEFLH